MPIITAPGPVEIDECHIGAKVREVNGRHPAPGRIVFGNKCWTTGHTLIFPVQNKTREVLLPILINHVENCATIISDKFSTYVSRNGRSNLEEIGFDHYFINHSLHFVDPIQPFIHINNTERIWRSLKASISHVKRALPDNTVYSFIDTFHF